MNARLWSWSFVGLFFLSILSNGVMGFDEMDLVSHFNGTNVYQKQDDDDANILVVGLTLVQSSADEGAVCLDGSVPGYHLFHGHGSGANNWIIRLQGGAWCDSIENCQNRKVSGYGSSTLMEKQLNFTGILSNKAAENPDFYNWNKAKIRYCDGASFSGDSENKAAQLQFRGKRIFLAVIEDLMAKGMRQAKQALLNGCSSGGLSAILRCDDFKSLFPLTTKVKCMSDAGFFLDASLSLYFFFSDFSLRCTHDSGEISPKPTANHIKIMNDYGTGQVRGSLPDEPSQPPQARSAPPRRARSTQLRPSCSLPSAPGQEAPSGSHSGQEAPSGSHLGGTTQVMEPRVGTGASGTGTWTDEDGFGTWDMNGIGIR